MKRDLTTYTVVHSYPTLAETMARYVPEAAGLSEAECLALTDAAKAAAPDYVTGHKQLAEWMRYYVAAKLGKR